jgi:hypothetical protein
VIGNDRGGGIFFEKFASKDQCLERLMTPKQKEIFLVIDEWWIRYGFGPSIDDIMYIGVVRMKEERTVMNKMNAEDENERCVCMYACVCLCVRLETCREAQ